MKITSEQTKRGQRYWLAEQRMPGGKLLLIEAPTYTEAQNGIYQALAATEVAMKIKAEEMLKQINQLRNGVAA
jgi:hypothetical protein